MPIFSILSEKKPLRRIPQGHKLHIAIADCSSLIGSHILHAAQGSSRIGSIVCFTSKVFPLISQCDKVYRVFTPNLNCLFSGPHSWASNLRERCTHLDAIVLLFDPHPQYGGIHTAMIKDSSLRPPGVDYSGALYYNDWAPIASIAEAAYDKGSSVCVWATLLSDTNTRDVEHMYHTKLTDVIMMHLSPQMAFIVNDGKFVKGCDHYWQTNIYPQLYKRSMLRWWTGCVLLSQVADAAIHWILTSNSCTNKDDKQQCIEYSSEQIYELARSMEQL